MICSIGTAVTSRCVLMISNLRKSCVSASPTRLRVPSLEGKTARLRPQAIFSLFSFENGFACMELTRRQAIFSLFSFENGFACMELTRNELLLPYLPVRRTPSRFRTRSSCPSRSDSGTVHANAINDDTYLFRVSSVRMPVWKPHATSNIAEAAVGMVAEPWGAYSQSQRQPRRHRPALRG